MTKQGWSQHRRSFVFAKSGGRCWYCGIDLTRDRFDIDHFVPVTGGGSGELRNLVPSCLVCNRVKGNRTLEWFRQRTENLLAGRPDFSDEQIEWLMERFHVHPYEEEGQARLEFYFEQEGLTA